jgi:uncharacterized protein (DUF58 family)
VNVYPTRASVDLAIASVVLVTAAVVLQQAAVLAWGGALLLGLIIARAATVVSVARIRAAGLEMLWRGEGRVRRVGRGELVEIEAELRNRDSRAARFVDLRAVNSPELSVTVEPSSGEVPGAGRLCVTLCVETPRVGRHGVHGLSLEIQGSPGLYEVPLTFANPLGVEVLPRPFATMLSTARGGRSRMSADEGRPGPFAGDGTELRELREHQAGDPFKRIAWKASARRGRLMVREYEREERDVVWLVLDASLELWSGQIGSAPLDHAIDEVAGVAHRHLARGDRVGLAVVGRRVLARLEPASGPTHAVTLMTMLAHATGCLDSDRSGLDESDVALRVLEHMRPLDPAAAHRVRLTDLDRVARRAERVRSRAPFQEIEVHAPSPRERLLRRYLGAFGIGSPSRLEPDRPYTDRQLADFLVRLRSARPRTSVVYLWSPPPDLASRPEMQRALAALPRRRMDLRWVVVPIERGISFEGTPIAPAVADAVALRARIAERRGERALRQLGVRVERVLPRHREKSAA